MLDVAIVDDNSIGLSSVKRITERFFLKNKVECQIFTFSSSLEFYQVCQDHFFHLILLDIDMPELNGIELAASLRKERSQCTLIFVSAYEHFVFESIRYRPFRFVRKSMLEIDLEEAVAAFCREIISHNMKIQFSKANGETPSILASDIVYVFSVKHDVFLVMKDQTEIRLAYHHYTIGELENQLRSFGFLRTDRSYLLNYRYIYQINPDCITLKTAVSKSEHDSIPISRRRYASVREQYQYFIREETEY